MITKKMGFGKYYYDPYKRHFAHCAGYCPNCETKVSMDNNEADEFYRNSWHLEHSKGIGHYVAKIIPHSIKEKIVQELQNC